MKLTLDYTGTAKGFKLKMDLDASIEQDAEALGYITNVLFETAKRLSEHLSKVDPKYDSRISKGVSRSTLEMLKEGSGSVYPFTTFVLQY